MKFPPAVLAPFLLAAAARAEVKLPAVFSDHMVLQRDAEVPVWGWAEPGESVQVAFAGQSKTAAADASGRWMVKLDAMPASAEPRELAVSSQSSSAKITDVLVGEVWLASGQSNMDYELSSAHNASEALPNALDDQLRFFKITKATAPEPMPDCTGAWVPTTPESAGNFSAVAFFFAQEIRRTQNCPVGIVQGAWGGTDIETWISLAGLKQPPPLTRPLERWEKALAGYENVKAKPDLAARYAKDIQDWKVNVYPAFAQAQKQWNADKADGKDPGPKPEPSRPEPTNPDPMGIPSPSKRPSTPTVNFNGIIAPVIPFGIRGVIWYQGEKNGGHGLEYRDLFPRLIEDWRGHWRAAGGTGGNFPFLFVQLPCNGKDPAPVATEGWPWLREAQFLTLKVPGTAMALTIDVGNPNDVHPANKIDIGKRLALLARRDAYHENLAASGPLYTSFTVDGNKARVRFRETGGGLTPASQPWCAKGVEPFPTDRLVGFFLAGGDRKWVEAEAVIDGDCVFVSSPQVPAPVAVRYGWANSPRCNLYNKEGLPASPFRTDDWTQ